MRYALLLFLLPVVFVSCEEAPTLSSISPINWDQRRAAVPTDSSMISGSTYLSIYSEVYGFTERQTFSLTATISMRNVNVTDTIYLDAAIYYDTHGKAIRTYFDFPIYVLPMETVEIVINERDLEGGTGGNFHFDWRADSTINEPFFEAVMISTTGQQGLSFLTDGVRLK